MKCFAVLKAATRVRMLSLGIDTQTQPQCTIVLPLVHCRVNDTLFEISTEIRGLGMSTSLLLLWKPRSWF